MGGRACVDQPMLAPQSMLNDMKDGAPPGRPRGGEGKAGQRGEISIFRLAKFMDAAPPQSQRSLFNGEIRSGLSRQRLIGENAFRHMV